MVSQAARSVHLSVTAPECAATALLSSWLTRSQSVPARSSVARGPVILSHDGSSTGVGRVGGRRVVGARRRGRRWEPGLVVRLPTVDCRHRTACCGLIGALRVTRPETLRPVVGCGHCRCTTACRSGVHDVGLPERPHACTRPPTPRDRRRRAVAVSTCRMADAFSDLGSRRIRQPRRGGGPAVPRPVSATQLHPGVPRQPLGRRGSARPGIGRRVAGSRHRPARRRGCRPRGDCRAASGGCCESQWLAPLPA